MFQYGASKRTARIVTTDVTIGTAAAQAKRFAAFNTAPHVVLIPLKTMLVRRTRYRVCASLSLSEEYPAASSGNMEEAVSMRMKHRMTRKPLVITVTVEKTR